MLQDKEVLSICTYWAERLQTKNVPADELVNAAYIVCKNLRAIELAHKWAKWTMVHLIQDSWKHHISIDTKNANDESIKDYIVDESFDVSEFNFEQEELQAIIDKCCNEEEVNLLHLVFWQGNTYRMVATKFNITFQAVGYKVNKVLQKLRHEYERRKK